MPTEVVHILTRPHYLEKEYYICFGQLVQLTNTSSTMEITVPIRISDFFIKYNNSDTLLVVYFSEFSKFEDFK